MKLFGKVKIMKAPTVFQLATFIFVFNALIHCATLLGSNFMKEDIYKIILNFIVFSIEST